jgi:hypothetical protein
VLHDDDLAEAIVDRILDRGRLLRLDGPSLRTKHLAGDTSLDDDQDGIGDRRVSGTNTAEFPEPTCSEDVGPVRGRPRCDVSFSQHPGASGDLTGPEAVG